MPIPDCRKFPHEGIGMSQGTLIRTPVRKVFTASQESCPFCENVLHISQHRERTIHRLDECIDLVARDKKCGHPGCPKPHLLYRPFEDNSLVLPGSHMGLDVLLEIGALRLQQGLSFPRIHTSLHERGVPISPMTVQYQFRSYLSLIACHAGRTRGPLLEKLRKQGVILPMIDGVQFGEGDAVLYLIIDALSKQPLFGKECVCRGAADLVPFIAQLKDLDIPILAVVSDKEKGLVPAIEEALPNTPHQFCQRHYLHNAVKPMEEDLKTLGAEVHDTEEQLRQLKRDLLRQQYKAQQIQAPMPADLPVTLQLCECARAEARCQGRAPFDPPALKRHVGLEKVAQTVHVALDKKKGLGTTWNALQVS